MIAGFVSVIVTRDLYKSSFRALVREICSREFRRREQKKDCRQGMQRTFWINFTTKQGQKLAKEVVSREVI